MKAKKWAFDTGGKSLGINGGVYSSPAIGADGTIYVGSHAGKVFALDEEGTTYVMPVGKEFKVERQNKLDELCIATPSICQGKLLIRTATQVYCIGNQSAGGR